MKVFLTGGSGFVGLALTRRLISMGVQVTSFSTSPPRPWASQALGRDQFTYVQGDILDRDGLLTTIAQMVPDVIVHAAAATPDNAREQAGNAVEIIAINVGGTANVIEAAAKAGIRRVVALSSVAVYGKTLADCSVLTEHETHCTPRNLYGISKFAAEKLSLRLGEVHGVFVVAPRLGVAWGPWEHRTEVRTTLSPMFQIVDLARRGKPIRLSDLVSAPLLYIDDAVDALTGLITADPFVTGIVNAGASQSTDLAAIAASVAARFDVPFETGAKDPNVVVFAANRPPMSPDRLRAVTGSAPGGSNEEQIDAYLEWIGQLDNPDAPFED